MQVRTAVMVECDTGDIALVQDRLEDARLEIRAPPLQHRQPRVERHLVPAPVDPADAPLGLFLGHRVEDRDERADAATRGDQHDRHAARHGGVQEEVARRVAAFDLLAGLDAVDQDARDHAGIVVAGVCGCSLERNPVVVASSGRIRHGVLSGLVVADFWHEQSYADVLPGEEFRKLFLVVWHQVKAVQVVGFADFAVYLELAPG